MATTFILILIFAPGVMAGLATGIGVPGIGGLAMALLLTFLYGMAIWLFFFATSATAAEFLRGTGLVALVAVVNAVPFWALGRLLRRRGT